jgi:hypothetical protein
MNNPRFPSYILAAALGLAAFHAQAQLLTSADKTQLETWLGSGPLQFTDIFSAVNGDGKTTVDFNNAADGKGATFTLASVTRGNNTYVIGGYDPVSWNGALEDYVFVTSRSAQTAFIYNLTADVIQRENTFGVGQNGSGDYQTLDAESLGPTFGESFDIAIGNDYSGFGSDLLTEGSTFNYSYGGSFGTDILGTPDIFTQGNRGQYDPFTINSLDVYTFGPATAGVPDRGSTVFPLGAAMLGLVALAHRRILA